MDTTLQFALNLTDTHSTVRGLLIDVTEAIVAEVTRLPQIGTRWFDRKATNSTAVRDFLVASEIVDARGEFIRYNFCFFEFYSFQQSKFNLVGIVYCQFPGAIACI